ncbi:uncharacterized protein TNCT_286411 [Trichonephila clavata]|nr:uncharacterized protein TNCT_286411 [Trichonephila clavata]
MQKELTTMKEESNRSQSEVARLLQIMSTSEEEKFALNQQINNLQQSLKEKDNQLNTLRRGQQGGGGSQTLPMPIRRSEPDSKDPSKQTPGAGPASFFSSFF